MNLSKIRNMTLEGDLSKEGLNYLIHCHGECERLDHKEFLFLESDKHLCDFTKDILALKNVGGGYITIGVKDKSWSPIGIADTPRYDTKLLSDKLRKAANVDLEIYITYHQINVNNSMKLFGLILVRSSQKRKYRPTVVGKDFCPSQSFGLRRGDIFIRRKDETIRIKSTEELTELLDEIESQYNQDALKNSQNLSPFIIEDGTYKLLEKGYETFIGRDELRKQLLIALTSDPRIWIINVHGPGGVGKSALINWAVYELYNNKRHVFESIIHLSAKDKILTSAGIKSFTRSLYSLENLFDHILITFQEQLSDSIEDKKNTVYEILSAWKTLLVLDNMESITDGRIIEFIQQLPVDTKAKVLITSRVKTGGWELPISMNELNISETREFLEIKSNEFQISFAFNNQITEKIWNVSGGLPLAIQWILGRFKKENNFDKAIEKVGKQDSPVLEFTFGNIWILLSTEAKKILSMMTIFDEPPTIQQIALSTDMSIEIVERAISELIDFTLVNKQVQQSDGQEKYISLPITLMFARQKLSLWDDFELKCRQRLQKYQRQIKLEESEIHRFRSEFDKYGLKTDNEKRASILCQRAFSEFYAGKIDNAELLFNEACDLAPQSSFIFAKRADYYLETNRIGLAIKCIEEAIKKVNKKTGCFCYSIEAKIYDIQNKYTEKMYSLGKALEYEPNNVVVQHKYGVALSRAGFPEKAIMQFDSIIEKEKNTPSEQLIFTIKTRMINLKRLNRIKELSNDYKYVQKIFNEFPFLSIHSKEFYEFEFLLQPNM